jgi:hypothetical protein
MAEETGEYCSEDYFFAKKHIVCIVEEQRFIIDV